MDFTLSDDKAKISTFEKALSDAIKEVNAKQAIINSHNSSLRNYRSREINYVYEIAMLKEDNRKLHRMVFTCYVVILSMFAMGLCLMLSSIFKAG